MKTEGSKLNLCWVSCFCTERIARSLPFKEEDLRTCISNLINFVHLICLYRARRIRD